MNKEDFYKLCDTLTGTQDKNFYDLWDIYDFSSQFFPYFRLETSIDNNIYYPNLLLDPGNSLSSLEQNKKNILKYLKQYIEKDTFTLIEKVAYACRKEISIGINKKQGYVDYNIGFVGEELQIKEVEIIAKILNIQVEHMRTQDYFLLVNFNASSLKSIKVYEIFSKDSYYDLTNAPLLGVFEKLGKNYLYLSRYTSVGQVSHKEYFSIDNPSLVLGDSILPSLYQIGFTNLLVDRFSGKPIVGIASEGEKHFEIYIDIYRNYGLGGDTSPYRDIIESFVQKDYREVVKRASTIKLEREYIYYITCYSCFQLGRVEKMREYYEQGCQKYPDSLLLQEIDILLQSLLGEYSGLLKQIESVHLQGYDSEILTCVKGQLYNDTGKYEEAINTYSLGLSKYMYSGMLWYYLGITYFTQGNIEEAYECFGKSIESEKFIYAYHGMIRCIKKQQGKEEAYVYYQNNFPKESELPNDNTLVGNIYYELEEYKKAIIFYKKSLENTPNDFGSYNGIANSLQKLGYFKKSVSFYESALELKLGHPYCCNGIGNAYFHLDDYTEALKHYQLALLGNTENSYSLYKIGMCYFLTNRHEKAQEFFLRSIKSNPSNKMCQRYLKKSQDKLRKNQYIRSEFLGESNLEFTANSSNGKLSKKVLYRCHGSVFEFKDKIHSFLIENTNSSCIASQIDMIFSLEEVQSLTFHFGEDKATGRIKFYISLYGIDFKKSLKIISQVKSIFGGEKYSLEKNFISFDCLGFDIYPDRVHFKVYEIISFSDSYTHLLPEYISIENIKEVGMLKSGKRKKIFFRLLEPLDMISSIDTSELEGLLRSELSYTMKGRITYYCRENKSEEIYFI